MKAHQTRLDVIGNNIANVNTYGFKSSRATFRDMYYQSIRGAAAGTANRGGLNPSSVGYGSAISSVDLLMTQSAMSTTGNPLDVCITGEGFFQVQDSEGNIFYTKAGMLDIDSNGNLVDSNGYYVLGTSGDPLGKAAGSNKIQFDIKPVSPTVSKLTDTINGMNFEITSTNTTKDANVSFYFQSATDLPLGQAAEAIIDGSAITIRLNSKESFANLGDLQKTVNDAITTALGGVAHPAGEFNFAMEPDPFAANGPLTGAEICGDNFGKTGGNVAIPDDLFGGFRFVSAGSNFSGRGEATFSLAHTPAEDGPPPVEESFEITMTCPNADGAGTNTYTATISASQMKTSGTVMLVSATDKSDSITLSYPTYSSVTGSADSGDADNGFTFTDVTQADAATPMEPSKDIGLSSKAFKLTGGTEGGSQSIKDLSSISIGADGVIIANHPVHGRISVGRIDLATFDNPKGLEQSGSTYFVATENSGKASLASPGENGTGELKNSALEMSNVDLAQEFADMITTQRGFQANSRIITVSDTMLEELINLKR